MQLIRLILFLLPLGTGVAPSVRSFSLEHIVGVIGPVRLGRMAGRRIRYRYGAEVEVMGRRKGDMILSQQFFQVSHSTLEVVDVCAGNLSFRNGVEADALDTGLFA